MNTTSIFHQSKMDLEGALTDFIKAAQKDDRDLTDELNEAIFNCCKVCRIHPLEITES